MSPIQKIAYNSPCFLPEETHHPRFRHFKERGPFLFSVILTANIGME